MFLLLRKYQDNESESPEMEVGAAGPIFTQKNIKRSMGQISPYSKIWKKHIWQLFMFVQLEPLCYYFLITKTLNMSNVKYKLAYLNQDSPRIVIKCSMGQQYQYYII